MAERVVYRVQGSDRDRLALRPVPPPQQGDDPLLFIVFEEFNIATYWCNVKLAADNGLAVPYLGLAIPTNDNDRDHIAVLAWQHDEQDDVVSRAAKYRELVNEQDDVVTELFVEEFGQNISTFLSGTDVRSVCVFTDRDALHRALVSPAATDPSIDILSCEAFGDDVVLFERHGFYATAASTHASSGRIAQDNSTTHRSEMDSRNSDMPEIPWSTSKRHHFLENLYNRAALRTPLHANPKVGTHSLRTYLGDSGMYFGYHVAQRSSRSELWIPTDSKDFFQRLNRHREQVNRRAGVGLVWGRHGNVDGYRVTYPIRTGGWGTAESHWRKLHDELIDAMIALESALRPHLRLFYDPELLNLLEDVDGNSKVLT